MPKSKTNHVGLTDTWGRRNRQLPDKLCPQCGMSFRPRRRHSVYCSRPCATANNGGRNKKQFVWWKNRKGYIEGRVRLDDGTTISYKQHRFVMEGILGRPLRNDEDVHHIDGDKSNNHPDNLRLISHGEHSTYHNKSRKYKRGYKLNLTETERNRRSLLAIATRLNDLGRMAKEKRKKEAQS